MSPEFWTAVMLADVVMDASFLALGVALGRYQRRADRTPSSLSRCGGRGDMYFLRVFPTAESRAETRANLDAAARRQAFLDGDGGQHE